MNELYFHYATRDVQDIANQYYWKNSLPKWKANNHLTIALTCSDFSTTITLNLTWVDNRFQQFRYSYNNGVALVSYVPCVYFTERMISCHPEVIRRRTRIINKVNDHNKNIQYIADQIIFNSLSPIIQRGIKLHESSPSPTEVYTFFKAEKFTNIPEEISDIKSCCVSQTTKYNHQTGVSLVPNWSTKTFEYIGWSSDD